MTNNKKIAFIGPKEYCQVMNFIGFESFYSLSKEESLKLIEKLKQEDYALILISQDISPEDIDFERVVSLPGMVKTSNPDYLKQEIRKAIGGDINLSLKN